MLTLPIAIKFKAKKQWVKEQIKYWTVKIRRREKLC